MVSIEDTEREHGRQHVQFMELLNMCRQDLQEIVQKVTA